MREIFVIYNSAIKLPGGGHPIDGGAGRIDREWDETHKDGSTMSDRIVQILAKKPRREVIYLPNGDLPNPDTDKINGKAAVPATERDREAIQALRPKFKIQLLEERIAALEAQLSN